MIVYYNLFIFLYQNCELVNYQWIKFNYRWLSDFMQLKKINYFVLWLAICTYLINRKTIWYNCIILCNTNICDVNELMANSNCFKKNTYPCINFFEWEQLSKINK